MRLRAEWVVLCVLGTACGSKWDFQDQDGDGISAAEGDCWDRSDGPEGSGLSGDDIHPDADETWYDGIDQNCAEDDDFDADKDGFVPEEYLGEETRGLPESGLLPGGDCWDVIDGPEGVEYGGAEIFPGSVDTWYDGVDQDCDGKKDDFDADQDGFVPDAFEGMATVGIPASGDLPGGDCWDDNESIPEAMVVAYGNTSGGDAVDWSQPSAKKVHPDASDVWYDGADQNCDGADDFDQDEDGFLTAHYPDQTGRIAGSDCIDQTDDLTGWLTDEYLEVLEDESPEVIAPSAIYPGAEDAWYDGVDSDCAEDDDCDQDLDGFRSPGDDASDCVVADDETAVRPCCPTAEEPVDCDDEDEDLKPDPSVEEIYFNGQDDNCDHSDGDGDLDDDGYWAWDYEDKVAEYAAAHPEEGEITPLDIPEDQDGDCIDDPDDPGLFAPGLGLEGFPADLVHPLATDIAYDGIDAGCEDNDDFDNDADGYVYDQYVGYTTYPVDGSGGLPGNDCNDLNADIYDGAPDDWYDGIDSDCAANVDYDADDDGYVQDIHEGELTHPWDTDEEDLPEMDDLPVLPGGDCEDGEDYSETFGGVTFTGADIFPGAADAWYDGVDSNCESDDDFDRDRDGYVRDEDEGESTYPVEGTGGLPDNDCDDGDAAIHDGAADFWYDGTDSNCDHEDDYDQDADGYVRNADVGKDTYPWSDLGDLPGNDCDDTRADMNPGESDTWYDGDDSNCSGNDDYDQDSDGYVRTGDVGEYTHPVSGSGGLPGNDCDDTRADMNPGETDVWYDGDDSDCGGNDDYDRDGDGYVRNSDVGESTYPVSGSGELPGGDCNDNRASQNPGENEDCNTTYDDNCDDDYDLVDADNCITYSLDEDRDGYGHLSATQCTCNPTGDYDTLDSTDCDDGNPYTYVGAAEDESGLCAKDEDEDGYGDDRTGFAWDAGSDCDDDVGSTYPSAPETCDTVDSDCDGNLNDEDSSGCTDFHRDGDGDGYGHPTLDRCYCEVTGSYTTTDDTDCDDGDDDISPGADEYCDGIDNDCDGSTDESDAEDASTWTIDGDEDGYGDPITAFDGCDPEDGSIAEPGTDCDDGDADIFPGADEYCDGEDNDCDDEIDEPDAVDATSWYADLDEDGYGDPTDSFFGCDPGDDSVTDDTDCDDSDEDIHPDQLDYADVGASGLEGVDEDCDEYIDEDEVFDLIDGGDDVLVMSEIQINPYGAEPGNEWFELYNASDLTLYLDGWSFSRVRSSGSTRTLYISPGASGGHLSIEPGEYAVMCARNGTAVGLGGICQYYYAQSGYYGVSSKCGSPVSTSFSLRNDGEFSITFGLYDTDCETASSGDYVEVDGADFDAFSVVEGQSLELATELVMGGSATDDNDDGLNWCNNSTDVYTGSSDMDSSDSGIQSNSGTPGVENTCVESDL